MPKKTKKGLLFAVITAVISGFAIFFNKLVIVKGIDPVIFNIIKNGGVALILTLMLTFNPQRKKLTKLSPRIWSKLLLIAVIGGSIPFILYFEGLKNVSAINANLIHKTLFIWVAMMALPFLGEKLTRVQIAGYVLIAWSNLFIGGFKPFEYNIGEMMILAATLFWSVENIIAKITLKEIDSQIVAWARMFFGSIILIIFAFITGKLPLLLSIAPSKLIPISLSIIFLTGYVISWYKALQFAPATTVTSVLILATPITNLLTAVFITHSLPLNHITSSIVTILGISLISLFISTPQKKDALYLSKK